jgi:predicted amidophosphoribosyltransferase
MGMDGLDYAGLVCKNCRESSPVFSAGRTLFHLNPAGRKLVHQIKYHGDKRILQDIPFFLERAPQFLEFITGAVLIPVPLQKEVAQKKVQPKPLDCRGLCQAGRSEHRGLRLYAPYPKHSQPDRARPE